MLKKIQISIIILILTTAQNSASNDVLRSPLKPDQIRVMTWNVQMLPKIGSIFSESLRKMQTERTDWIIEHIRSGNYDIIMLQECFDHSFVRALNYRLAEDYPYQINPKKPNIFKLSNGLMILSKFPLIDLKTIQFEHASKTDWWVSKGAVFAKVFIHDQVLNIVNTHLQADYDDEEYTSIRQFQLREIYEKIIQPIGIDSTRILVAGDLNIKENIQSDEYLRMKEILVMKDVVFDYFKEPSISFDKKNYWNKEEESSSRLDYILSNKKLQKLKIEIIKPKKKYKEKIIDLADHYGILASIEL